MHTVSTDNPQDIRFLGRVNAQHSHDGKRSLEANLMWSTGIAKFTFETCLLKSTDTKNLFNDTKICLMGRPSRAISGLSHNKDRNP